jgi:transcriptional regulator with XRE-family HTH domain
MPKTTLDVDALYAALDQKRQSEELSWRDLASKLTISPSTFTRMAQGKRPDVDTFATLVDWLGVPTAAFLRSSDTPATDPDPIAMFSSYLRSAKNIAPEDADALEDIMQAAARRLLRK